MPDTPADRLRAARLAVDLTQAELAGRLGISQGYLADMERGRKAPSLEILVAVAGATGADPHDLDERLASRRPR